MDQNNVGIRAQRNLRLSLLALALAATGSLHASPHGSIDGTVQRVWDDGFQLDTGTRRITVDAYDLCGDFTHRHIVVGEQLRVTGELEGGEFDAFTLMRADGRRVCSERPTAELLRPSA